MTTVMEDLSQMYSLRNISNQDIQKMMRNCSAKVYRPGEIICKQGDPAKEAMLLVRGKLDVSVSSQHSKQQVGKIHPGEIFGEQGLFIANKNRNATVKATEKSICIKIDPKVLKQSEQNPAMIALEKQLLISMARRLRNTNQTIQKQWREEKPEPVESKEPQKFNLLYWFSQLF